MKFPIVAILLLLALPQPALASAPVAGPPVLGAWTEFLPYSKVQWVLPHLARMGVTAYIAVRDSSLQDDEFFKTWSEAQALGHEMRPWILLNEADGYWANKWNEPKIEAMIDRFLEAMRARGMTTKWITLDFEPPPEFNRHLTDELAKKNIFGAWKILMDGARTGNFKKAKAAYMALVKRLHERGIKVHAVTTPFVIHDLKNHDYRVQNAFGIPVQDIPFDEVTFMVYRADFKRMLGNVSEDLVYRYAKVARKYYGDRVGLDLGEVGLIPFPQIHMGYEDPTELNKDYSAAQAAGVRRMNTYSVDGIYAELVKDPTNVARWYSPPPAKKPKMNFLARMYLSLLDIMAGLLPKPN